MSKWIIVTNIPGEPTEEFDDYEAARHMHDGLIESFKSFGGSLGLTNTEKVEVYLAEVVDYNEFDN